MKNTVIIFLVLLLLCIATPSSSIEKLSIKDVPPDLPSGIINHVKNLFSDSPVNRAQSAQSLGHIKNPQALPFLYSLIDDTYSLKISTNPLNQGVLMVGDIRTTPGVEALISIWNIGKNEQLDKILDIYKENESRLVKTNIINAMRGINSDKATQFLDQIIKDELKKDKKQYWLIETAILTMKYKSDDLANEVLIDYTNYSPDEYVRRKAIYSFVSSHKIRDKNKIQEVMEKGLIDSSVDIKRSVAFYLPHMESRELLPLTRQLLENEKDEIVLSGLIRFIANMKDEKSSETLIALLDSESQRIRKDAASAIGEIKSDIALAPLVERLKIETIDTVQCSIVHALGELGNNEAIEPIISATRLSDKKKGYMKYEGPKALKKITGQDFEYDLDKYEQWWKKTHSK